MKRKWHWGRVAGLIIGLTCVVAVLFASRILNKFRDGKTSLGDVISGIRNPRGQFPNQDHLTLLLLGQDYNHDKHDYVTSKGTRADTIMLLSVDLDKRTMRACSIPLDTYVQAPDGKTGKINATFTRGGPQLVKKTLESLFDVKIDNYVVIKPDAVRNIVDSIGGVEVESLDVMNYDDSWGGLHVHLPAGRQVVDGKGAEGFVRFREVNRYRILQDNTIVPLTNIKHSKEEGDIRRMARQQQLIQALVHAANKPGNLIKADSIIETGFNQIVTDLPKVKCMALAALLKGSSKGSMVSGTVPGKDTKKNGVYFFELDAERSKATIDWILRGDDSAAKKLVRVSIKNGTKVPGVAKMLAAKLVDQGYTATSNGNAVPSPVTNIVYQKAAQAEIAKNIQTIVGSRTIGKATTVAVGQPDIEIVIGEDLASKILADSKAITQKH